jgi:hypothetical protein
MEVVSSNDNPQIVAACGNCLYFLSGLMNHQMVNMCRKVPPAPVPFPDGTVSFVQPVVDATCFCFGYHPNKETAERATKLGVPVLVPGSGRVDSPIATNGTPRRN